MLGRSLFIFSFCTILISCSSLGFSESRISYGCLEGDKKKITLTKAGNSIGIASISKACIEEKVYTDIVELKFCSVDICACNESPNIEDMFFMDFSFREKEWAIKKINFIKDRHTLYKTMERYDVYSYEGEDDQVKYIPKTEDIFSVECWKDFGTCKMEGAHGDMEYSVETTKKFRSVDWIDLHKNIKKFVFEATSLK